MPEQCREQRAALDAACADIGRDPASIRYSLMIRCIVGRTADEFEERARRNQEHAGREGSVRDYIDQLPPHWLVGTVDRMQELVEAYAAAGVEQLMLQHLLVDDLEMLDLVAEEFVS